MKIMPVTDIFIQRTQRFSMSKIAFGEIDGDFYDYSPHRMSKEQYEAKKNIINKKYDRMRSSYLDVCDDVGINASLMWDRLHQIEQRRELDLAKLNSEYNI